MGAGWEAPDAEGLARIHCMCVQWLQSCPTLCNHMDCSPPGSSVPAILQVRILEWVALPSSKASSWPGDRTGISCSAGGVFAAEPPGKPPCEHCRVKQTRSGNLLYSIGSSAQCSVMTQTGGMPGGGTPKKEGMYVSLWPIRAVVQQKLTEYCKPIILLLEKQNTQLVRKQHQAELTENMQTHRWF